MELRDWSSDVCSSDLGIGSISGINCGPIRNLRCLWLMGPCGLFRHYRPICTWGFTYLVELFGNMGSYYSVVVWSKCLQRIRVPAKQEYEDMRVKCTWQVTSVPCKTRECNHGSEMIGGGHRMLSRVITGTTMEPMKASTDELKRRTSNTNNNPILEI